MKNIGLFGGTFDPVHRGHTELARCAMNLCDLGEVIFIPAAAPPHKKNSSVATFKHRVEMLKLAVSVEENFSISTIEETLASPNYTIDTLTLFLKNTIAPCNYFFIIGVDAFLEIHTWKDSEGVLSSVNFIVSAREGYISELFYAYMKNLCYSRKGSFWYNTKNGKKIYYLKSDIPDISSSKVREGLRQRNLSSDMIKPEVLKYMGEHRLYTTEIEVS